MAEQPTHSRIISRDVAIEVKGRPTIAGYAEHFPQGRSLVVFDDSGLAPVMLSLTAKEAPDEVAALAEDEVLLADWVERRGVAEWLEQHGLVETLRRVPVQVGIFPQEAVLVRVL